MEQMKKVLWKHIGGGILRLNDGRKIKMGETFLAYPNEIPKSFQDTNISLETTVDPGGTDFVKVVYKVEKRGNSNWFNVVNSSGKVVNDKALRKSEAFELVKKLEG